MLGITPYRLDARGYRAPDTIEEMMNFGFVHFDAEDNSLEALSPIIIS